MPAIIDDPDAPPIFRVSGVAPFPDPRNPTLPVTIHPRQVTLRDRQTQATIVPFVSKNQVPPSLLLYLSDQFKKEIEGGDTYPMIEPMPFEKFVSYWFQNFGAIMLLGSIDGPEEVVEGKDWAKECLGSFYIKPNYPGRSSHICNAGFLVTDASRNRGVGRLMGESYLDWAPKLAYTYSVFNLVYETNVASCKIWDALGFKRIGRVKGCGNLKSYPGRLIDAIIYGRDLVLGESDEIVSEERFDKIKFYLKYAKYPHGADRAEKSRLRSAATHYKLLEGDKLMLKDKEVISDPQRQFDIARQVHVIQHGGINKTTATIAERYHWSRIKETVSDVIKNCTECKELGKTPIPNNNSPAVKGRPNLNSTSTPSNDTNHTTSITNTTPSADQSFGPPRGVSAAGRRILQREPIPEPKSPPLVPFSVTTAAYRGPEPITVMSPGQTLHTPTDSPIPKQRTIPMHSPMLQGQLLHPSHHHHHDATSNALPLSSPDTVFQPIDPQIISQPSPHHDPFGPFHAHTDSFQAFLNADDDDDDDDVGDGTAAAANHRTVEEQEADREAMDRDLEAMDRDLDMLIAQQDDDGDDDVDEVGSMDVEAGPGMSHYATKMDISSLLADDLEEGGGHERKRKQKDGPVYDAQFGAPG